MITAEYEPQTLRRLWDVEKDIYQEFTRICDQHGLTYFCAYGTALGAIRHKGFIPWDDDMDMGMPREDYEKFIEIAPRELGAQYALLEPRTTKGYVMAFAKLTRSDTTFIEATDQDRTYHSGIFIDIFPFDPIYEDRQRREKLERKCWLLARLCVLTAYKSPKLPAEMSPLKKGIARFGCGALYYMLKLLGFSTVKIYQKYLKAAAQAAKDGASGLYTDLILYRLEDNYGQEDVCYSSETLFPTVTVPFDGISVAVPRDYDRYLTRTFGDYMQLPPEEKRHAHYPAVLRFGA